jgi:hypothetical protein
MSNKRIQQALEWLEKEQKKDELEIENYKTKIIQDLKNVDKTKMFVKPEKKKISIFNKILMIFGYGRK